MDDEASEERGAMGMPMADDPASGLGDGGSNTGQKKVVHEGEGVQASVTIESVNVSSIRHDLICNPLGYRDIKIYLIRTVLG
jgi:hypothetical protein